MANGDRTANKVATVYIWCSPLVSPDTVVATQPNCRYKLKKKKNGIPATHRHSKSSAKRKPNKASTVGSIRILMKKKRVWHSQRGEQWHFQWRRRWLKPINIFGCVCGRSVREITNKMRDNRRAHATDATPTTFAINH